MIGRQGDSKEAWHEVTYAECKHIVFLGFYITEFIKIAMFPEVILFTL